jgi:hypothetical protein
MNITHKPYELTSSDHMTQTSTHYERTYYFTIISEQARTTHHRQRITGMSIM